MTYVYRRPVLGLFPPNAHRSRLENIKREKKRRILDDRKRKPSKSGDVVIYDYSDEESLRHQQIFLNTSYNVVDYVRSREILMKEPRWIEPDYCTKCLLAHNMLRKCPINLFDTENVLCSQWLNDYQIIFGTECNKIKVYDVVKKRLCQVKNIGRVLNSNLLNKKFTLKINPSYSLLATNARNSCEIAIYSVPLLKPICVLEKAHATSVIGVCWLDEQHLFSATKGRFLALWKICDNIIEPEPSEHDNPCYRHVEALDCKKCETASKISTLLINKAANEVVVLSAQETIHIWDARLFRQKLSYKLKGIIDSQCIAANENSSLYAIGGRSSIILIDPRTLHTVKTISADEECWIRSCSFYYNILTLGTSSGKAMFYDIRTQKYLADHLSTNRVIFLRTSAYENDQLSNNLSELRQGIYTHCFNNSGTRFFCGGGRFIENSACIWQ